jgi:hypothetical protein
MLPAGLSSLWLKDVPRVVNAQWWESPNYLAVVGFVASSALAFALFYWLRRTRQLSWRSFALVGAAAGAIHGVIFILASFGHDAFRLPGSMMLVTGGALGILVSQLTRLSFLQTMRAVHQPTPNTSLERTRER